MKLQQVSLALTAVNLVLLVVVLWQGRTAATARDTSVLRGSRLELVDENGQLRARLNTEADGQVVFRLLDQEGTIRVKLGADTLGSGLLLADETTEPGVHLVARRVGTDDRPATTAITLTGADGRQKYISP